MKNLTANGTTFPIQRTPTDGDAGAEASFEPPYQDAANRTEYLRNLVESLGVRKVRTVTTVAALKAMTGVVTGDIAMLTAGGTRGLYVFDAGTTLAQDFPPFGYQGQAVAGRWLSPLFAIVDTTNAANVVLDPQTVQVPNRIVEILSTTKTSDMSFTHSATWQVVHSLTRTLAVGDQVQLRALARLMTTDAATNLELLWRLRVTSPGGSNTLLGSDLGQLAPWANKKFQIATEGLWTASVAGAHTFALEVLAPIFGGGSYTVDALAPVSLRGLWIRP